MVKPCTACKRKECPHPCYPYRDWLRGTKRRRKNEKNDDHRRVSRTETAE